MRHGPLLVLDGASLCDGRSRHQWRPEILVKGQDMLALYQVTLTAAWSHEKGGKKYHVAATSNDSAVDQVQTVEPYYNPEWGVMVCKVTRGKPHLPPMKAH